MCTFASHVRNSYTMASQDLPDIYALARGPHGISNIYHLSVLTKANIGPFGSLYKRPSEF